MGEEYPGPLIVNTTGEKLSDTVYYWAKLATEVLPNSKGPVVVTEVVGGLSLPSGEQAELIPDPQDPPNTN